MTLSTKAEHEHARETSYVEDEVATHVSPEGAFAAARWIRDFSAS